MAMTAVSSLMPTGTGLEDCFTWSEDIGGSCTREYDDDTPTAAGTGLRRFDPTGRSSYEVAMADCGGGVPGLLLIAGGSLSRVL